MIDFQSLLMNLHNYANSRKLGKLCHFLKDSAGAFLTVLRIRIQRIRIILPNPNRKYFPWIHMSSFVRFWKKQLKILKKFFSLPNSESELEPDPYQPEKWDPDPHQNGPEPPHCFLGQANKIMLNYYVCDLSKINVFAVDSSAPVRT